MKTLGLFICVIICLVYSVNANSDDDGQNAVVFVKDPETDESDQFNKVDKIYMSDEVFVPTSEWQTIKPDQGIPRGLHVRMNIQTGLKEAKLLEDEPNNTVDKKKKTPYDKLKSSLENLNDDNLENSKNIETSAGEENVFRSYEKLKEELKESNINLLSDTQAIKSLVSNLKNSEDKEQKLQILDDLEYYVHKFDNGLVLCDIGGFNLLMNNLNKSQDLDLKSNYILTLGSSLQSNPYVKIHALDSNLLQLILNQIDNKSIKADKSIVELFMSRLIFSLSGLLRNFPVAQNKFIQYGGIKTLNQLLKRNDYTFKLKTKVLTLINDLAAERIDGTVKDTDESSDKASEYAKYDFIQQIKETDLCEQFEPILAVTSSNDSYEKIFDALLTLVEHCKGSFNGSFRGLLSELNEKFDQMAREDEENDTDGYFLGISKKIRAILVNIQ